MLTMTHPWASARANALFARAQRLSRPLRRGLEFVAPGADLLVRLWVAQVFFKAGLTKIQSWDITVQLFTYEYQVPLLDPATAALLGTAAELVLPVFLALGLAGRAAAEILQGKPIAACSPALGVAMVIAAVSPCLEAAAPFLLQASRNAGELARIQVAWRRAMVMEAALWVRALTGGAAALGETPALICRTRADSRQ